MGSRDALTPKEQGVEDTSPFEQYVALTCLAGLLAINIALIHLQVADFPLRGVAVIGLLGAVGLLYPERLLNAVQQHALVLWLALTLALLGTFVSLTNGTSFPVIVRGLLEVPLQVGVTLLLASVLAQIAGPRRSALVIVAVIGISAVAGVLQFLGAEFAWDLREWFGSIQGELAHEDSPLINRRPMGLSYSPIQLSTQLCLAFAVYTAARERQRQPLEGKSSADLTIVLALSLLFAGSVVTGTRSPILGGLVFFLIYAVRRPGSWLLFLVLVGATALYLIGPTLMEVLHEAQPRIVRTDDNSATSRASLFTFGLLLLADNPLGYGFAFNPNEHWVKFWHDLYYQTNPTGVMSAELHNYPLNMLNTYGIGLLLTVPFVVTLLGRGGHAVIFFIPYIVHIMFHNSGPFWTDLPFWFVIAALSVTAAAPPLEETSAELEPGRFAATPGHKR